MYYKTCEICGLKAGRVGDQKRTFMAKFPLDEERCKKWVKVTGKEDLAYVPIEKLNELKYICGKHFRPKDFKKKKTQLRKNAVPSLLVPAKPLPDEILIGFPLHSYGHSNTSLITIVGTDNLKRKKSCETKPVASTVKSRVKKKRSCSPNNICPPVDLLKSCKTRNTQNECDKDLEPVEDNMMDSDDDSSSDDQTEECTFSWQKPYTAVPCDTADVSTGKTVDADLFIYDDPLKPSSAVVDEEPVKPSSAVMPDDTVKPSSAVMPDDTVKPSSAGMPDDTVKPSSAGMPDDTVKSTSAVPSTATDGANAVHKEFTCNVCLGFISRFRYTCLHCADYDLCGVCEALGKHAQHYMLRVPGPRPYSEIQSVLNTIREWLLKETIILVEGAAEDEPTNKIKEEPDDPIDVEEELMEKCSRYVPSAGHKRTNGTENFEDDEAPWLPPSEVSEDHQTLENEHIKEHRIKAPTAVPQIKLGSVQVVPRIETSNVIDKDIDHNVESGKVVVQRINIEDTPSDNTDSVRNTKHNVSIQGNNIQEITVNKPIVTKKVIKVIDTNVLQRMRLLQNAKDVSSEIAGNVLKTPTAFKAPGSASSNTLTIPSVFKLSTGAAGDVVLKPFKVINKRNIVTLNPSNLQQITAQTVPRVTSSNIINRPNIQKDTSKQIIFLKHPLILNSGKAQNRLNNENVKYTFVLEKVKPTELGHSTVDSVQDEASCVLTNVTEPH